MLKKTLLSLITAAFAIIPSTAQDTDEILNGYFEQTGQENLARVNTVTMIGKIDQMGMVLPFKTISKRPNKGYFEAEFEGTLMKMAFDGKRGWIVMPMTGSEDPTDLYGPDLKQVQEIGDIDGPLWNWKEKGHQLEYEGSEDVEGSSAHVLKLTKEDGDVIYFYIGSQNMLLLKTRAMRMMNGQEVETESITSDHRNVNDIIQPFKIVSSVGGQTITSITLEEIRYDENVGDNVFVKPGTE